MPLPYQPLHHFPRTVGVIGGGTAGYFSALALKRRFPELQVTLVESSAVPIIGVGEATTTLMPPFLHRQLGLDIVDLFRSVRPTFKLGIKFEWGLPGPEHYFTYPFGEAWPLEACAYDGDLRTQSFVSRLMAGNQGPVVRSPEGTLLSLLPSLKFAYHLENKAFVAFLARAARTAGIEHLDVKIESVEVGPAGIASLRGADGRQLQFDFYVDASGFRSLLLERALGSSFESYASTLFCDRAIVATVPQGDTVQPFTTAETMNAGWCWRIPVGGEDHRGYVHSSAFLDEDAAIAELRAKNPGMEEPSIVRFRSGRHHDFWVGNTVGVGNAYGFVEPLESTALHMVIIELGQILGVLEGLHDQRADRRTQEHASQAIGGHWDYLRWFLGAHYRFNRRLDTPFWRAVWAQTNLSGFSELLERFRTEGPWLQADAARSSVADPAFGYSGLMMILLGQAVEGSARTRPAMERAAWEKLSAQHAGVAARALPQREALEALHANPDMLRSFVQAPNSWIQREGWQPGC